MKLDQRMLKHTRRPQKYYSSSNSKNNTIISGDAGS